MTILELVAELNRRGASMRIDRAGRLRVGPASMINDLHPAISAMRDELLYLAAIESRNEPKARELRAILPLATLSGLPLPDDPDLATGECFDRCERAWDAGDVAGAELWATEFEKLAAALWGTSAS